MSARAATASELCQALAEMLHDYRETGCSLEPAACLVFYEEMKAATENLAQAAGRIRAACAAIDRLRTNVGRIDGLSWELAAASLREVADEIAEDFGCEVIPFPSGRPPSRPAA